MRHRYVLLAVLLVAPLAQAQTFTDASALLPVVPIPFSPGASLVDVDLDGRVDIYRRQGLYLNRGASFQRVEGVPLLDAGFWGAVFADFSGDGLPDMYVIGERLARNSPARYFVEAPLPIGLAAPQGSLWFDYDRDGWLDLYVGDDIFNDRLFRNLGGDGFEDVSALLALPTARQTYGTAAADFDRDGDPDVYVGACSGDLVASTNVLYRNDGAAGFADVASAAGTADDRMAWGVVWFDFDNDGWLDLYVANMPGGIGRDGFNNLFRNNGDGTFTDVAAAAGVAGLEDEDSWSAAAADFDNDGWLDLYVANNPEPSRLYRNNGDGTFTDIAASAGIADLSYIAVAAGDIDGDGWVDLFIPRGGEFERDALMLNDGGTNGWLVVHARGTASNRLGVGARVEVTAGGRTQVREITAGDGFVSQSHALRAHFGLGTATEADVTVRWPSGQVDQLSGVAIDQEVTVVEGEGRNEPPAPFALTFPADGSVFEEGTASVRLSWEPAPDPEGAPVTYSVYLAGPNADTTLVVEGTELVLPLGGLPHGSYHWAVTATDGRSVRGAAERFGFVNVSPTSVEAPPDAGSEVWVEAFPNPSDGAVTVAYRLPVAGRARVAVYDLLGREVAVLAEGAHHSGAHRVTWAAPTVPGGAYFVRVETAAGGATHRITRLR